MVAGRRGGSWWVAADQSALWPVLFCRGSRGLRRHRWLGSGDGGLRTRATALTLGVPFTFATCFVAWWVWYSRADDLQTPQNQGFSYSLVETLLRLPGERFRFYADQVVGRFSYGETTASPLLIVAGTGCSPRSSSRRLAWATGCDWPSSGCSRRALASCRA